MNWTHSRIMSTADDGTAIVIAGDDGWEALPFGFDGGSCGTYPSRDEAILTVEGVLGDMICCVGHLADTPTAEDGRSRAARTAGSGWSRW